MYEIIITTKDFILEYAKIEISSFTSNDIIQNNNQLVINFDDKEEVFDFVLDLIYYSRTIEYIYLKENNELIDLVGFNLSQRDYKLNKDENSINSLIVNYCLYKLGLDKEKILKIVDPQANLGDLIIEASLFSNQAFNVQKRYILPITKKFNLNPKLPKGKDIKNKVVAIVQDNKTFKQIKENINYSRTKIKLSQYDIDWLDVKFKKNDFDYCITQIIDFDEEFLDEFFYQLEFIIRKKICIISEDKINTKHFKKHKLKLEEFTNIEDYNIYFLSK